jgi:type IV pilus assembly protein PilY1
MTQSMNSTAPLRSRLVTLAVAMALSAGAASAAPLTISETPLFVASGNKPNVLLTISNSNSMDENASGLAVGSAAPNSRSEIARRVAKNLVTNYGGGLNMGLMAFQQFVGGGDAVRLQFLHSSPYDVSFDPANYDAGYTGARTGPTRRFREPNPSWPGHFYYFNVNLPFYAGSNQGTGFCYSGTAQAFNNGENPVGFAGPWDTYRCFTQKTSASDTLPDAGTEAAEGWSGYFGSYGFLPTDSDLGQGITDFGRFLSWTFVSPTWFSNGSPGGGYLHVPIATVTPAQTTALNTKLGTSQFVTNGPTDAAQPLQNAGLTPLEGTLYTIRDYFQGNLSDVARGGPQPAPPNSCGKNYSVILTNGLPSVTRTGVPSADVVTLLADATTAAAAAHTSGVLNYIVGFALPFGVNPAQLDTIAAGGGTGSSYYATDEATLTSELNRVFNDILVRSGAAGAVALNSGSIRTNSRIFQAKFNTGDWSGQLQAFPVNATTGAIGAAIWDAGVRVDLQNWDTGRTILAYNPSSEQGIAFRWPANPASPTATTLNAAQILALNTSPSAAVDALGGTRLAYLRGSTANEGNGAANFRRRNVSRLGDIVNSSPAFVGRPSLNISDSTYATFKSTYASRTEMIYVGANDGMLHGFDASTGNELLAFVPTPVFPKLSGLTAQGFTHRYLVDGSPTVSDIKFSDGWHTELVSGLSGGGRGLFALDVTDPSSFNETSPTSTVLWEFTSADDNELGLTYAQPTIIKLNNGEPGVVVGNGYNNTGSGHAILFIINAETGDLIRKLDTGVGTVGTPNGLSTPAVIDLDGNGTADYAYAGDLRGNIWKFDLSDTSDGSWSIDYSGSPLYTAVDGGGTPQPITSAIEVSRHPQSGLMVLFGTGKYVETTDVTNSATQSLYGIRDNGAVVASRSDLVAQTVLETATVDGRTYRAVSANAVNWSTKSGWYIDLPTSGERVVVDPILRNGRFIVPTTIPSTDPCAVGGYSWLMELDFLGGGRLNVAAFDVNQDTLVDNSDAVAFSTNGSLQASGLRLDAIASTPSVIRGFGPDGSLENKYLNQSTGGIAQVRESGQPLSNRRTSWRQIQ